MNMKFKICIVLSCIFLHLSNVYSQETMPVSWFTAPEDIRDPIKKDNKEDTGPDEELKKLLNVNEQAISTTGFFKRQEKGIMDDWALERFIFTLGLGLKGTLGLVTLGGKGSFEFHYLPKEDKNLFPETPATQDSENALDITVDKDFGPAQMEKQIDRVSALAYATKKVKNKNVLRENLRKYAMDFLDFTIGLNNADPGGEWFVFGYEMTLAVEASGKVQPEVDVGGEVRIRLRWRKQVDPINPPPLTAKQLEVRNFIMGLSDDLSLVSSNMTFENYKLHQMDLGLAFTAKGNIVVVKAKGEIEGRVLLRRHGNKNLAKWKPKSLSGQKNHILLYDDYKYHVVEYAEEHGIPYEIEITEREDKSKYTRVIYKIGRERLRKGLERTIKVAKFFHNISFIREINGWEIGEMRMRYDFSVEGVLPFVTIGGKAVSELYFVK